MSTIDKAYGSLMAGVNRANGKGSSVDEKLDAFVKQFRAKGVATIAGKDFEITMKKSG